MVSSAPVTVATLPRTATWCCAGAWLNRSIAWAKTSPPSEVETLLSGTPGISAAAVFPMPDRALGERTVAAIVAQPGVNRSAILDDFLTRGVARYKVPDQVITVDEIPLINIGKVDKKSCVLSRQRNLLTVNPNKAERTRP